MTIGDAQHWGGRNLPFWSPHVTAPSRYPHTSVSLSSHVRFLPPLSGALRSPCAPATTALWCPPVTAPPLGCDPLGSGRGAGCGAEWERLGGAGEGRLPQSPLALSERGRTPAPSSWLSCSATRRGVPGALAGGVNVTAVGFPLGPVTVASRRESLRGKTGPPVFPQIQSC